MVDVKWAAKSIKGAWPTFGWALLLVTSAGRVVAAVSPPPLAPEQVRGLMGMDKKVQGGRLHLVLLRGIGQALLTADYDPAVLVATLSARAA